MDKQRILIIEDDPTIVLGLRDALSFEGYEILSAATGEEGVSLAHNSNPDAVVLDLMLPDTNGFRVCEQLRSLNRLLPIIMLTARSEEADKIRGLDAGADDYVTKPFSVGEFIARMRAILRRVERGAEPQPESFAVGKAEVNLSTHTIRRGKKTTQLSFYEVGVLRLLHQRAGQPVSRDDILETVWGLEASPTNRTVDNFIVKLRKKIERTPDEPEYILTVYGFGYKLVVP